MPDEETSPSAEQSNPEPESASLLIPFDHEEQQFIKGYN